MVRRIAWVLALVVLLTTGALGVYNGATEWRDAQTGLQLSVALGVLLYAAVRHFWTHHRVRSLSEPSLEPLERGALGRHPHVRRRHGSPGLCTGCRVVGGRAHEWCGECPGRGRRAMDGVDLDAARSGSVASAQTHVT
jgi:hypothetical protein